MSDVPNPTGIENLLLVEPGTFWRGGQPKFATDWAWLKDEGKITSVVKLNTEGEYTEDGARALGLPVVYKPISLFEQLVFRPNYKDVMAAVDAIAPGTYVHCEHGQDRTGLVIACYRVWVAGWEKDAAWAEMLMHGFHVDLLGLTLFWEWAV